MMDPIFGLFLVFVGFVAYFLPAIIADCRFHRNWKAILALNLFFGWSLFGWILALIWALTDNVQPKEPNKEIQR